MTAQITPDATRRRDHAIAKEDDDLSRYLSLESQVATIDHEIAIDHIAFSDMNVSQIVGLGFCKGSPAHAKQHKEQA